MKLREKGKKEKMKLNSAFLSTNKSLISVSLVYKKGNELQLVLTRLYSIRAEGKIGVRRRLWLRGIKYLYEMIKMC